MTAAAFWFVNTADVEPLLGTKAGRPAFGDLVSGVDVWLEDEVKQVRDANGEQVVSSTTLSTSLEDAALFPVGSRVTLPSRIAFVITNSRFDSGSLALGLDHAEITLT